MVRKFLKKIIPPFFLNIYHLALSFLGAVIFAFPSKSIKVIGITGTNGKSTVVDFTSRILEEAGFKVASISSIRFKIGENEWPNFLKMTMPEGFLIQKFLREAKKEKCQYAVLEVTSQGIVQHRHRFIRFDVALITNLAPEHIEAHRGFENYRKAKGKLFKATRNIHIVNLDDQNAEYFLQFPAKKKYGFTLSQNFQQESRTTIRRVEKLIMAEKIEDSFQGISFFVDNIRFNLRLLGKFNVYNALAAISVALSQGIDLEKCKSALEKIGKIPGRMELVIEKPFKVIVDYAVTPESLEEVYKAIKKYFSPSKLICIFGACGGGRDKWKRPKLGEIASKYCQKIFLTNEDPYDEDPEKILEDIEKGIEKGEKIKKIIDRKKAIREALKEAKEDDVIIITGKGCEPWICVKDGKKIPWDDRKVVLEEFKKLKNEKI
jgi:UDP-N-acetylmuramoyl-L-alanyl-D-glutamate--2,6-diaminopimelate ligase